MLQIPYPPFGLARELKALLDMPARQRLALGARARRRVEEKYEISHVVRQYEIFYKELSES